MQTARPIAAAGGIGQATGTPPGAAPAMGGPGGMIPPSAQGRDQGRPAPANPAERAAGQGAGTPGDSAAGVLSRGAAAPIGQTPLGGTREAGDLRPVSSTPLLSSAASTQAVSEDRGLSRQSGGAARSNSVYGAGLQDQADAFAAQKGLADIDRGRPAGSSLPPINVPGQRIPGAVSGPGAAPAAPSAPGSSDRQTAAERTGENAAGTPIGTIADNESSGLFVNGAFAPQGTAGYTPEGYNIFIGSNGYYSETPDGWRLEAGPGSDTAPPPASSAPATETSKRGLTAGSGGDTPPAAAPPAAAPPAAHPGQAGPPSQRPAGAPASSGPGPEAQAHARRTGQDPADIQWLLDNGVPLSAITAEGVSGPGITDPDFLGGDVAEWDDMYDPEAGLLFRMSQERGQRLGTQDTGTADANAQNSIEGMLRRLQEMKTPGIDPAALEGLLRAQGQSAAHRQSTALSSTLADAAASGLSPGAATGMGSRLMTDMSIAANSQEAQTRMQAELANLGGKQQAYGAYAGALGLLPQVAMQRAGQTGSASIQAKLMQLQQQMGWTDAEFQQNMQDGFGDYLLSMLGAVGNGAAAGLTGGLAQGVGGAVSKWLGT
jgi:hypothetical protein